MALNINDKKVGKSSSFSVGRCFGFSEIDPVTGSITIFCSVESGPEMMIPLVDPGAARY